MIVITGAAGFIGSCMVAKLNNEGVNQLLLVDDFTQEVKKINWEGKKYVETIQRDCFFPWAENNIRHIDFIIHLGARTDTTEQNYDLLKSLNFDYSQQIWSFAANNGIPLLYASSAATYGDGKFGYGDDGRTMDKIIPLNPYGKSKHEFDKWVMKQTKTPPYWAGFKFFNVYGEGESHKGRMASVIYHAFHQINEKGSVELFRSHKPDFEDGMQLRDFIYVKDITSVLYWFMQKPRNSGIYNLGTGFARSFLSLVIATFKAMKREPSINFIDIPVDIREQYQYYTQAEMKKLKMNGYKKPFHSLEYGVTNYVNFLIKEKMNKII